MKGLFFTALAILASSPLTQAQQVVAEGDFENWAPRSFNALGPQGWTTLDDVFVAGGFPFITNAVRRTVNSYSGQYAAELVTVINPTLGEQTPGILVLGNGLTSLAAKIPGGTPYTTRAANAALYYKLTGPNLAADSAYVQVQLTRTTGGILQVIASAEQVLLTAAPTYTPLVLPFRYQAGGLPDTLRWAMTSGSGNVRNAGTTLTVDGVHLTGIVMATHEEVTEPAVTVYPTVSGDGWFYLSARTQPGSLQGALRVYDALGRIVWRQAAQPGEVADRAIDLRQQAPGIYFLRIETATAVLTRRLVVQ